MNIIKRTDVVPILYFGGTGGQFLATLLYHAKNNNTDYWKFSEYGNAHYSKKDFAGTGNSTGKHMWISPVEHVDSILRIPITNSIIYGPSHCADPALALTYIDKIIKTHFTVDDLEEISIVFAVKWGIDDKGFDLTQLKELLETRKKAYEEFTSLVNEFYDTENKVLNLSWQEILHADPSILIRKLSLFTEIPYENFSMYHFLKWRELTNKALTKFRNVLQPLFGTLAQIRTEDAP